MTEQWAHIIVAAIVCGSVVFTVVAIAAFVNADTLAKAYKRLRGKTRRCSWCAGSCMYNGKTCEHCDGTGEVV